MPDNSHKHHSEVIYTKYHLWCLNSLQHLNTIGSNNNTNLPDFTLIGLTDSEVVRQVLLCCFSWYSCLPCWGMQGQYCQFTWISRCTTPMYFSSVTCHSWASITEWSSHLKFQRICWLPTSIYHSQSTSPGCCFWSSYHWVFPSAFNGLWPLIIL